LFKYIMDEIKFKMADIIYNKSSK